MRAGSPLLFVWLLDIRDMLRHGNSTVLSCMGFDSWWLPDAPVPVRTVFLRMGARVFAGSSFADVRVRTPRYK